MRLSEENLFISLIRELLQIGLDDLVWTAPEFTR